MIYPLKGTAFARVAIAKANGGGSAYADARWGLDAPQLRAVTTGAITSDSGYVGLVDTPGAADFLESVSEIAVTGRLPLRRTPLNVRLMSTLEGSSAGWVGEGKAKPVKKLSFAAETMRAKKVAAITVVSDELLRAQSVEAEQLIRSDMTRAAVAALEVKFLSDDAVSDDAPAGILQGVSQIMATGFVDQDLRAIVASFTGDLSRAWWVARPEVFTHLSGAVYPLVGLRGGELLGAPAVATRHAPEDTFLLVNPDRIAFGAVGARVETSKEAMIAMADPAAGNMNADDSPVTVTGLGGDAGEKTDLVSLWEQNATGILCELLVNWRALPGAVAALDTAAWNTEESPA